MEKEIYKMIPINDYENYKVSNFGNVINISTDKILKLSLKMGYYYVSMKKNSDKRDKNFRVHRLVALSFIPNDDKSKKFVNHINGNKLDNKVSNLEWMKPKDNVKHAYQNGLIKPFERK